MLVYDTIKKCNTLISGVYAPAQAQDKDSFWAQLLQMHHVVDIPWCILGDLNELANHSEKQGGKRYPLSKFNRLNRFLDTINGLSIPVNGNPFTWKNRIHNQMIYERLDRAIARNDWITLYPDSIIRHGTFSCSDHCPIIMTAFSPIHRRKHLPFRFQNYWCQYRQLDPIVDKQWQVHDQGTKMFKLAQKLKRTKIHIKTWARNFLGNNHQKLMLNAQKVDQIESLLVHQPHSIRLNSWMQRMLRQREKLLLYNQKYWGTLKRQEWLVHGDRNSRFFQQQANTRRKKKLICKLKDACGIWLDNPQAIADKFVQDYSTRFLSGSNINRYSTERMLDTSITEAENRQLIRIPDMCEVKEALFSIDSSKTPGPDGFGSGFFKQYWELIKQDFFSCIVEFFEKGKLLRQINHTFLALIPKNNDPSETHHFRPISLCNTVYKTISKLLVNRLCPLLDRLVSPSQSLLFLADLFMRISFLLMKSCISLGKLKVSKPG